MDRKLYYFRKALDMLPKSDNVEQYDIKVGFDHQVKDNPDGIKSIEYVFYFHKDDKAPKGWHHYKTGIIEFK